MKLIRSLNNLKLTEPLCLTIGNFDGFHLGHQKIISNIKSLCAKHNYKSAILTFEPHPYSFFKKENNKKFRISSLSQKLQFIKDSNIDYAIILPFNSNLSQISANNFINEILVNKLNTKHIIIGYDFVFGKNRSGNINTLIDNCLIKNRRKIIEIINDNNFLTEETIQIIRIYLSKAKRLLKLAYEIKKTNNIDSAIISHKPPIFWKDKEIVKNQLKIWSTDKLNELIIRISSLELLVKKNSHNSINILIDFILKETVKNSSNYS